MTEQHVGGRPPEFWEAVRADYYGRVLTINAILAKYELTLGEFNYAKLQLGWKRRYQSKVGRASIINRLFRLVDRLSNNLEIRMSEDAEGTGEKEAGVLGQLVTIMGRLIDIEDAGNRKPTPGQTKEMHDIRRKLIDRIEELKRA